MIKLTLPTPCAPTVKSLFPALDQIADKIVAIFDKGDAKDDTIGSNGGYTFTIADLLKNDVNAKASTFFFGDGLDALHQAKYMADHGIVDNHNGTYTATAGHDFEYSVLTGTGLCQSYSVADVDVKDAPPVPHAGACLFTENFDNYANIANPTMWSWAAVNLGNHGWQNAGVDTEVAVNGYAGVMSGTSGGYWFVRTRPAPQVGAILR
jgi:hypothetical protein